MKHGAGWVILEISHHRESKQLVSILPPRKTREDVVWFMQQIYVDRFSSIQGRLDYKKSPSSYPLQPLVDRYAPIIHLGHDPFFAGIYSRCITVVGKTLEFHYRIAVDISDPFNLVYADRSQSVTVDG